MKSRDLLAHVKISEVFVSACDFNQMEINHGFWLRISVWCAGMYITDILRDCIANKANEKFYSLSQGKEITIFYFNKM